MKARAHPLVLAATVAAAPRTAMQAPTIGKSNPAIRDGFARDHVRRHWRGPVAGGTTFGALGGALGGGPPVLAIGAAIGAGGGDRAAVYNSLYRQACDTCISS